MLRLGMLKRRSNRKEILRQLAQGYLNQRRAEEKKKDFVIGSDDKERHHRKKGCIRQLESRFGEVLVDRIGYRGVGLNSVFPLDSELNLPPNKYSHGLQDEIAQLVAVESFDETLESLERQGGGILPKRQLQEVAADLAQDFDEFYEQPLEPPEEGERILVITADGKGVSMHNQDLRPATRLEAEKAVDKKKMRLQPGEKRGYKRMATVVSVYEVEPNQRTPEQILNLNGETKPKSPVPSSKRVWAEITEGMGVAIEQGFEEAIRRDPQQQMKWVVLIDGQTELIRQVQETAKKFQVEVTITQDLIHVIEYLWKAVHVLHPDNKVKQEEWIRDRVYSMLHSNAQNVASGLRRAATRRKLDQKKRKSVDTAANYIENNQERLQYHESLEQGFPIATGVIEGACRHLVKDRMDITGARWRLKSADAVLKLRSLKVSGDLKKYLRFHFWKEKIRNYAWDANNDVCSTVA
jgi:hypothetical protein